MAKLSIYGESTLRALREHAPDADKLILASTVHYCLTEIRDTLRGLESILSEPATYRGSLPSRLFAQKGKPLSMEAANAETEKARDDHFTSLEDSFRTLDLLTNRLGDVGYVLANHLLVTASDEENGALVAELVSFDPHAIYNEGRIKYSAEREGYSTIDEFAAYTSLKEKTGNNPLLQPLLSTKMASAALRASIDYTLLRKIKNVKDYPSDAHSEVVDALNVFEDSMDSLRSAELPADARGMVADADRRFFTKLTQAYVTHKSNPMFARIVGGWGLVNGMASLYLGIPQVVNWISSGAIDFSTTPVVISPNADMTAVALTSAAMCAIVYSLLTFGSDLGKSLVESLRDKKFYQVVEV